MESEVRKALQGIAGRKAMGVDSLPIELIKAAGEPAITALTALCHQIWSIQTGNNSFNSAMPSDMVNTNQQ
jgi:hypothetical protein